MLAEHGIAWDSGCLLKVSLPFHTVVALQVLPHTKKNSLSYLFPLLPAKPCSQEHWRRPMGVSLVLPMCRNRHTSLVR